MSLTTFLTKIWAGIKNLFDGFPSELKTAVHIGVIVPKLLKLLSIAPKQMY